MRSLVIANESKVSAAWSVTVHTMRIVLPLVPALRLALSTLVLGGCASAATNPPADLPAAYVRYRPPAVCADSASARSAPIPQNYDDVRRWSVLTRPDVFPSKGPVHTAFLWYFIREDGRTEEVRLWQSSGSSAMDDVALEAGRQMLWQPLRCAGQAVATWYGHPIAMGGTP